MLRGELFQSCNLRSNGFKFPLPHEVRDQAQAGSYCTRGRFNRGPISLCRRIVLPLGGEELGFQNQSLNVQRRRGERGFDRLGAALPVPIGGREPGAVTEQLDQPGVALTLPDSVAVGPTELVARRRPDVRSAEEQVDASGAYVRAARADYLPRLALAGGAGYTSSRFDALGDGGTPRYTFGPVVSWPAFDIGRVKANADAARAAQSEAKARHRQTVLRSIEEVEVSLRTYGKARERLKHLEDAAAASERAAELARLRFTEGASDFLSVLDAERTMLEAQDRLALGRTQATTALVAVYRATGGAR